MGYNKNKFGCFWTTIIIVLVTCLSFIIVVGGPAAIDKSCEKLAEYKHKVHCKFANVLGMQVIGEDTTKVVVTPVVINDTLPKIKPFNGDDKDAIKIKLEIKDNMMYIRPKVNGIEMRFLLDTGCHDIHLTPIEVLFMEHQGIFDSKKAIGTEKCIYADGQEHECAVYMLNSVELGGIKIDSVKFTTDPNGGSPDDTPLFGQKVLNRFGDIMINYGDSTLIIKKKNVK
jgi:predicted aspartyl protease